MFWLGLIFFCGGGGGGPGGGGTYLGKRRRGFKSTAYNYTSSIVFSIVKHVFSDGTINFDVVSGKEDGTRSIIFPTVKHVFSDGTVNFEVVS